MNTSESTSSSSDQQLNCLDPGKWKIENWFLPSSTEKKPGSITFCYHGTHALQRHFIFLSSRMVSQASNANIYTKYQFLWWHRLLSHGVITETRNLLEPNTVSLLGGGGEEKPNLMKICFTVWWIFLKLKKSINIGQILPPLSLYSEGF